MSEEHTDPRDAILDRDVYPVVAKPRAVLSGAGIAILCGLLGIVLFFVLDGNRRRSTESGIGQAAMPNNMISAPPPLSIPAPAPVDRSIVVVPVSQDERPEPPRSSPPVQVQPTYSAPIYETYPPAQPEPVPQPRRVEPVERSSPLIIDLGDGDPLSNSSAPAAAGDDQAVRATVIRNRANLVPQGSIISAVLETPIDNRRPGMVRAVVSRDARGFDGTKVLIPRGSRLIGEAAGDAKAGQKRVLVTWTRLIRPDGVAIRIGSPAADVLGGAGIRGRVNNHFLERFGNAVLQSALTIGVNIASRPRGNSVILGLPGQVSATSQNLIPNVEAGPTIRVASGAEISVFVARDLDFSGTGLRR